MLTLKEAIEASEAANYGILSENALRNVAVNALTIAGPDPAIGTERQRKLLQDTLKTNLRYESADCLVIQEMVREIDVDYLIRWGMALEQGSANLRPERAARSIATYLLDNGLNSGFLHRWLTSKIRKKETSALPEIVASAQAMVSKPPEIFRALVAFESAPENRSQMPSQWIEASQVSDWLNRNGFSSAGIRQNGGLWIIVSAREPSSAIDAVIEMIDRMTARVAVGRNAELKPLPFAWIEGQRKAYPLRHRRRGVEIHALYRENQLYPEGPNSIVDAAIELLAPLAYSSPSAAVAGGWAAIEALLGSRGDTDKGFAGDRMAMIVACSFPRAELTPLSYVVEKQGGDLAVRIGACETNRDRAALLVEAINSKADLHLPDLSDQAALRRIEELLLNPYRAIHDIRGHVTAAFRRLYRQRNLVLHGGRTDAVALRASLRTAAPLVGAGMDRLAHAWLVNKVQPLELAAKAKIKLEECERTPCIDLLA